MLKIVLVGITFAFILVYLKSIASEFYSVALLGASVIMISFALEYLSVAIGFFEKVYLITGLSEEFYKIVLKITGIAFVVEFGCGIIEDLGIKGLSDKLCFVGKVAIVSASIPVITAVFGFLTDFLK